MTRRKKYTGGLPPNNLSPSQPRPFPIVWYNLIGYYYSPLTSAYTAY